jgi:hypothetical protein
MLRPPRIVLVQPDKCRTSLYRIRSCSVVSLVRGSALRAIMRPRTCPLILELGHAAHIVLRGFCTRCLHDYRNS